MIRLVVVAALLLIVATDCFAQSAVGGGVYGPPITAGQCIDVAAGVVGVEPDCIDDAQIAADAIDATSLASGACATSEILDGTITEDDINANLAGSGLGWTAGAPGSMKTESSEASFISTSALTCTAHAGAMSLVTDVLSYCESDGVGTKYTASGNSSGESTAAANDSVALTTDTTGSYVASATSGGGLTVSAAEGGTVGMTVGATDNSIKLWDNDAPAGWENRVLSTGLVVGPTGITVDDSIFSPLGPTIGNTSAEFSEPTSFDARTVEMQGSVLRLPDGGTTSLTCTSSTGTRFQIMDNGNVEWCDGGSVPTAEYSIAPFGLSIDDTEMTTENFGDFTCTSLEDGCTLNTDSISANELNASGVETELEGVLDHDDLQGYTADKHVAHSGVTFTAAAGLSGGGTIAANRDLAIASQESGFFADGGTTDLTCTTAQGAGSAQVMDDGSIQTCSGASTPAMSVLVPSVPLEGWEKTNNFTYAGQGTGACSGDICRGGVCSGTTPDGTCTLTPNTHYWKIITTYSINPQAFQLDINGFTVTGGTITLDTTNITTYGMPAIFRVRTNVSITEDVSTAIFDFRYIGTRGATGGTLVAANAGLGAGSSLFNLGGLGGAGTGANGTGGQAFNLYTSLENALAISLGLPVFVGTGGGNAKVTGQTNAATSNLAGGRGIYASTGGGGPGCASGSGTVGEGGRGGGGILFVVGGTYSCDATGTPSDEFKLDGVTPAGYGAGGGGGGVLTVVARRFGTNDCNVESSGGTGTAGLTDCTYSGGTGAKGGSLYINTTTGAVTSAGDPD